MNLDNLKQFIIKYQKIVYIALYIIASITIWQFFEEIFILIFAGLLILFYFVFLKLFKLILSKYQKVPGAGINLKLTSAFIFITSVPLVLVLLYTSKIINQFIESTLHQPLAINLEQLKELSTYRLYSDAFDTYVKSNPFVAEIKSYLYPINLAFLKKGLTQETFEKRFSHLIDFFIFFKVENDKVIEVVSVAKKTGKIISIETLTEIFDNVNQEDLFQLEGETIPSRLDDELEILYYIKRFQHQDERYYFIVAKYVNALDLAIAKKIGTISTSYSKREITKDQAVIDFEKIIFLIGAPTLLIAILISFVLARSLLKPIESLVIGTKEVAKGNLDYEISKVGEGELGELISSFNYMTGELLKNKDELYRMEKMAAWREVARRLAHEIKNPLTPIKLASERLQRQYHRGDENFPNILDSCSNVIISEVERLRVLVNEFSQFAQLPKIKKKTENIVKIVSELVNIYSTSHSQAKIELINNLTEQSNMIVIDGEKLKQVIINLIENSVDAIQGEIEITISLENVYDNLSKKCLLTIKDNGEGMPKEKLKRIFEPYYSTKEKGSGLGLSIVSNIIEEHHGNIYVQSEEGKGTSFTIEIPYHSEDL